MSIQSQADWRGLRQAANVARLTLDALEAQVCPGVTTGALDAIASRLFARHGARSAPKLVYGFPGTVLISVNDEIVHGIPGARRIAQGDIVKLDVTVEKNGYIADAARSVVVGEGERRRIGWWRVQRRRFRPHWRSLAPASASTRSDERSRAKYAGRDSPSWTGWPGTGSGGRFTKSPPSPTATIRVSGTC
jgi:methionine aminopeptidase